MAATQLGRNDLCRCGSGKKFKKCCLPRQMGFLTDGSVLRAPPPTQQPAKPQAKPKGKRRDTLDEESLKAFEWVEYVFVKGKGWTHESELKPGDQYRLKDDSWETVEPDRTIETTHEHPFYVKDKGWTPVNQIKPGDFLRTEDGWVSVKNVSDTGRVETVYNLRVEEHHTYFVGRREWGYGVWAHNTCYEIRAIAGNRFGLFNSTTGEAVFLEGRAITANSAEGVRLLATDASRIEASAIAATRSTQSLINEAAELGIGVQQLEIQGQVARIRISQNFTNATADFTQFAQSLRLQGVREVVVDTGPVVAPQLAARYRSIAASGGTVRGGGRIRLVSETRSSIPGREGELIPRFEILYDIP